MRALKPSQDRKIREYKSGTNTLGLLPGPTGGGTCPCATTGPGGCAEKPGGRKTMVCYVDKLMRAYPDIRRQLAHNTKLLKNASFDEKLELLDREFDRYEQSVERRKASGRPLNRIGYRWHWSGDFYDGEYSDAAAAAMLNHPGIKFWGYTRSFFLVDSFRRVRNLNLFLSLDTANMEEGIDRYIEAVDNADETSPQYRMAFMGRSEEELERFRALLDAAGLEDIEIGTCPVDTGEMDLEDACAKCRKCVKTDPEHIWLKTK